MKPLLHVCQLHRPGEAAKVQHVIEYQAGRRSFLRGPGRRTGEAIPNTDGEYGREEGQDEDITQLARPGTDRPTQAADKCQNTGIEENVQLEEKRKRFSTREGGQQSVLFGRQDALLLPLLQSREYGHAVV